VRATAATNKYDPLCNIDSTIGQTQKFDNFVEKLQGFEPLFQGGEIETIVACESENLHTQRNLMFTTLKYSSKT
jgi:hypothetical protein